MSIISKLRDTGKLSASEQEIAKYILDNAHSVLRMSIREIAKATYTSPTTVLRLCSKITNEGFAEFRVLLSSEINSYSPKALSLEEEKLAENMIETELIIASIEKNIVESLRLTSKLINNEELIQILKIIKQSSTIDVYGRGASNSVGEDFHYKLFRLGFNVHIYKGIDLQFIQAQTSDPSHCALIISSSGETPEIVKIAEILNIKGTPVITLTGSQDSELLKHSDYPLYFKCFESNLRVGAITSRSAMQYVLDVLYFLILNSDYEKYSEKVLTTYVPSDLLSKKV